RDCYVAFVPTASQTYRVEVQNRVRLEAWLQHRNGPNSGTLKFKESDLLAGFPAPGAVPPPQAAVQPPAPAGANGWSLDWPANARTSRFVHFQAGRPVDITVTSEQQSDVDLYVFEGVREVASDTTVGPNCRVSFVPARAGMYRVEVRNLGPGPNRSHVR